MRSADLSQLPVIDDGRLSGILDESDLLLHVSADPAGFHSLVEGTMTIRIETLAPDASLQMLRDTLDRGLAAIVADDSGDNKRFYGLITRFDLLNHLRRTLP
jgi:cystathionine beta-synthase